MIHEVYITQKHIDNGQPGDFFLDAFTLALNDRFENITHDTHIDKDGGWISVAKDYEQERIAYICDSKVKQWLSDYYTNKTVKPFTLLLDDTKKWAMDKVAHNKRQKKLRDELNKIKVKMAQKD